MSHILEFLDLVDTPSTFVDQAGKTVAVNALATALEFVTGVNASSIDGKSVSAASPADGDVLVYDGVTDLRWENVTPPWLAKTGGTMTAGDLTLFQNPTNNMHAANKKWIEDNFSAGSHNHDSTYLKLDASNDPMTGTLEWTNAAGPSIMNEAATGTNPTLVPNKADPDTGVGWSGTNTLSLIAEGAETLDIANGTVSLIAADLVLGKGETLQGKDSVGNAIAILSVNDATDYIVAGNVSYPITIDGTFIYANADVLMPDGDAIQFQNISETWVDALTVSSGVLHLGSTFTSISIDDPISSAVVLNNTIAIQGREVGGTARNLALVNASDEVEVGSSSVELNLMGTTLDTIPNLTCALIFDNAAGPEIVNEAATTTNPTLIPNRADLTTGIGWVSSTVVLISSGVNTLAVKGGSIVATAADILLTTNNRALQGKDTEGNTQDLVIITASDITCLGSSSLATKIYGTSVTSLTDIRVDGANAYQLNLGGTSGVFYDALSVDSTGSDFVVLGNTSFETKIATSGGVILANSKPLQGTALISGSFIDLIELTSGNEVAVGDATVALNLLGTQIDSITALANTVYLRGEETGGTARNLIGVDGSNYIVVGNSTTTVLELQAASYVRLNNMGAVRIGDISGGQYVTIGGTDGNVLLSGNAYFATANRIDAPELRGREWRTTAQDTGLVNNTASSLVRWDSSTGESVGLVIPYKVHCQYTESASTKYYVESGIITFASVNVSGTTTRNSTIFGATTVNTGTGTVAVTTTTGGSTNWSQVYLKVNVTGTGTFVSAHVEYHVINSDTSNTALSNWAT